MKHSQLKLFGYISCPYVQRIRFALDYLSINYEYEEVDIITYKQKTPQYLAINPFSKVPSLLLPSGESIFESIPLLEFLEDSYQGVFPKELARRALQRIWIGQFEQNVMSKFWSILLPYKQRQTDQMDKISLEVLENLSTFTKNSGLHATINKFPNGLYEGGNKDNFKPTFADFVLIPSIRAIDIFYRRLNNNPLLQQKAQSDASIQSLLQYYHNGLEVPAFKNITTNLKVFPPKEQSILLQQWQGQFNYEEFALLYQKTKYNA